MWSKADKQSLRLQIKTLRRQLSCTQKTFFESQIIHQIKHHYLFRSSHRVAFYLAHDNEVDLSALIHCARRLHKNIFLPALHPHKQNTLVFVRVHESTKLIKNRFGIFEPKINDHDATPTWQLDLVLAPLVAFDSQCRRLGMGGGFYDRTFEHKIRNKSAKPALMGVAYDFQKVNHVPTRAWDVPMNGVVTSTRIY